MSRAKEWALISITFLFLSLNYASSQPVTPLNQGLGESGGVYHAMAAAMPRQLPPKGDAPTVYRVGFPLAVAGVAKSLDWVISAGFDRLNFLAGAFSVFGLALLLQRHVSSVIARLIVIVAFMLDPHSPMRLSYFTPIFLNSATLALLIAGLLAIDAYRARPNFRRAAVLALIVATGVTVHEIVIIVGLAAVFARAAQRDLTYRREWGWLPLVAGLVTMAALHTWILPNQPGFTYWSEMLRWAEDKSPARYLLSWFFVFGPLLAVVLASWRRATAFLGAQRSLLVYLILLAAYAWVGGPETEELLSYASPIVWLLIARGIDAGGLALSSPVTLAILGAQLLSSRAFVTIGGPVDGTMIQGHSWDRMGWAGLRTFLSYENMRTQYGFPLIINTFYALYAATAVAIVFLLRRGHEQLSQVPQPAEPAVATSAATTLPDSRSVAKPMRTGIVLGVAWPLALAPVVWLSLADFYGSHFSSATPGYLLYNLARVWTGIVLFAVFWSTGLRILKTPPARCLSAGACVTHIECIVAGTAAWSVGMVLLATVHLYYLWLVLVLVAIGAGIALNDLLRAPAIDHTATGHPAFAQLLRIAGIASAIVLLISVVLWGDTAGDNDVFGTYLAYYQTVLDTHSNGPNPYYVHYWITKGHGLGFLFNILSDVQGVSIATFGVILVGAAMVFRMAILQGVAAYAIGWAGVCVYLAFYMFGGAVAKPHTIRNTLVLYLALSFAAQIAFHDAESVLYRRSRLIVITAILLLTPMAIALLQPILVVECLAVWFLHGRAAAIPMTIYPLWTTAATVSIWLFNYLAVGLPEAPLVMQGHFMNVERFARWLDPALAYLRFGGTTAVAERAVGTQAGEVIVRVFNPTAFFTDFSTRFMQLLADSTGVAAVLLLGAGVAALLFALVLRPRGRVSSVELRRVLMAVAYLAFVTAVLLGLRMLGGGASGSSTARFTDFIDPLLAAMGVLLLTAAWFELPDSRFRFAINGLCLVATLTSLAVTLESQWVPGVNFLIGKESFASMHETTWGAASAARVSASIPGSSPVELLTEAPGLTGLPRTRFQVPDGCVYCKEFGKVAFGTAGEAEAIYRQVGIDYFAFDVASGSAVLWSGFGRLFADEAIRSRLQVVSHFPFDSRDFYVLTWRSPGEAPSPLLATFLEKWNAKVAREQKTGSYAAFAEVAARSR